MCIRDRFPDYAAADESTALDGVNQSTHVMLSVAQGITITETDLSLIHICISSCWTGRHN